MKSFETADLHLASYLRAKGARLVNHYQDSRKVYFAFDPNGTLQDLIEEYWNDGSVGVSSYVKAMDDLKCIIFAHKPR